ncbi:MAG: class I SAM-dependent RNA methyltransferase [Leucobacter sp.]
MFSRSHAADTSLAVGDTIELDVTGIAHGGVCVARHNGRVVFVTDTIPGERVRAYVTDVKKKSFARAAAVEVLDASADRRKHVWPEASIERNPDDRVGGADFGYIALERQRSLKAEVLAEAMQRFGGLELAAAEGEDLRGALAGLVEPVPSDDIADGTGLIPLDDENHPQHGAHAQRAQHRQRNQHPHHGHHADLAEIAAAEAATPGLGYRTRVRLHVDPETGAVGPYAARSRRVIPVASLPLATRSINQIAPLHELMPRVATVDLVAPSADDPRMLLTLAGDKSRTGENDVVHELVGDRSFIVRAGGFWQVHREAPEVLFNAVRNAVTDLIDDDRFDPAAGNLDLYGGTGLLAAAMAEAAGPKLKVTTVESVANATDDAAENLADLVGALALTGRVNTYLADLLKAAAPVRDRMRRGTVVLDPPRTGAGGEVIGQLLELSPANVVYVACDPVALARDTKTLRDGGYDITGLRAFDIFPNTHHFETLAVFQRA